MQAAHEDEVDSPTATANGPAVQPVSVEKQKKPAKAAAKQAENAPENGQAGSAAQEDPEKKAKKVRDMRQWKGQPFCCWLAV